ncbi:MAG TPA: hypothetical protein VMG82_18530 [Candidatus Sulfotelmatobacter sp.]|nr:hypothetical protein [Candidatus Sulfotelmatobacter sp.]
MKSLLRKDRVRVLPYPDGKAFAFTIVDDTDGSTLDTVRIIYDFIFSLGLKTTKTVWVRNPKRAPQKQADTGDTLENEEYVSYIQLLRERGFEIALHNVSSGSNKRADIVSGIAAFARILGHSPKINVHHEKNLENMYFQFAQSGRHLPGPFRTTLFRMMHRLLGRSARQTAVSDHGCSGEDPRSEYFWGDVCRSSFKYVRTNVFFPELNTLKFSPGMPYQLTETPYVNYWFDSSNGQDVHHFNSILSDRNINKLRNENGCCVLYTHFGKGFVEAQDGTFQLNAETRQRLRAIAGHADGWYAPVSAMLDRLMTFQHVTVLRLEDSTLITNHNNSAIQSVTLQAMPYATCLDSTGKISMVGAGGWLVIPTLPAGASVAILGPAASSPARWNEDTRNPLVVDISKLVRKLCEQKPQLSRPQNIETYS